jgi:hypothetical protein
MAAGVRLLEREKNKNFPRKNENQQMFRHGRLKNGEQQFIGFASIDINDGRIWKFRKAKIASTFTAEALAIGETLEAVDKIDSEQNLMIFSDSVSVLQSNSNSGTMYNISHITQMLKDKIERLESRGKNPNFTGSRGIVE